MVNSNGVSADHQPLVLVSAKGRNELTSKPIVGAIHATVSPMTTMWRTYLCS